MSDTLNGLMFAYGIVAGGVLIAIPIGHAEGVIDDVPQAIAAAILWPLAILLVVLVGASRMIRAALRAMQ